MMNRGEGITKQRTNEKKSFYAAYRDTFNVVKAETPEMLEDIFKLRYDVYCSENGYINPAFHKGNMECNRYDAKAEHFALIHKDSDRIIGTARVIFPEHGDKQSFPVQTFCAHPIMHEPERIQNMCQISRFCMVKDFRRRDGDGTLLPRYSPPENIKGSTDTGDMVYIRRRVPYAPLGLFMAVFDEALSHGLTDCVMNIEESQLQAFNKMGMSYQMLGDVIYPHGAMQPVMFNMKNMMDTMLIQNQSCWDVMSDMGRVHKKANNLHMNDWHDMVAGYGDMIP